MMFNYPSFGLRPRTYPYKYYNYSAYRNRYNNHFSISRQIPIKENPEGKENPIEKFSENRNYCKDDQFLSILGIKLYFDDLIILALLFFLYNEGVKDDGLFICLILLLLS